MIRLTASNFSAIERTQNIAGTKRHPHPGIPGVSPPGLQVLSTRSHFAYQMDCNPESLSTLVAVAEDFRVNSNMDNFHQLMAKFNRDSSFVRNSRQAQSWIEFVASNFDDPRWNDESTIFVDICQLDLKSYYFIHAIFSFLP